MLSNEQFNMFDGWFRSKHEGRFDAIFVSNMAQYLRDWGFEDFNNFKHWRLCDSNLGIFNFFP